MNCPGSCRSLVLKDIVMTNESFLCICSANVLAFPLYPRTGRANSEERTAESGEGWRSQFHLLREAERCEIGKSRRRLAINMPSQKLSLHLLQFEPLCIPQRSQASRGVRIRIRKSCQKAVGGSPHRRRPRQTDTFAEALAKFPPPPPPALIRKLGSKELCGLGKVMWLNQYEGKTQSEYHNFPKSGRQSAVQSCRTSEAIHYRQTAEGKKLLDISQEELPLGTVTIVLYHDQPVHGTVAGLQMTDLGDKKEPATPLSLPSV
ncbi:unnamed protein product [Nezara viridula]|uniref:Uncharacterized protein n=1 Tax=Nezara viridula TaxID=85310 RepID=A0A9P0MVP3_NEZVI|nr:unnamed protein product [Nezara viridula]